MSHKYVAVAWNPRKKAFDAFLAAGVLLYLAVFVGGSLAALGADAPSEEILLLRGAGSAALVLLHVVLAIGPLTRLDARFAPLLYNRRHLGVLLFFLALVHAVVVSITYFGFAARDPLYNLLSVEGGDADGPFGVFPLLGLMALGALALLATTSHDFWQKVLGPVAWKSIHMLVYPAYALVVVHVALGALRSEHGSALVVGLGAGAGLLSSLHLAAALRSRRVDEDARASEDDWLDVGPAERFPLDRARSVRLPSGARLAVVRHAGGLSALHGVCAHQAGPLYEGRVIDGCLTCPWHGWQYRPEDGRSPPPFEERIASYPIRVREGRVEIREVPNG
ncbi:MAG: Rieske 2Fe-2S domain-containing protein [Myxococcota bacterium]